MSIAPGLSARPFLSLPAGTTAGRSQRSVPELFIHRLFEVVQKPLQIARDELDRAGLPRREAKRCTCCVADLFGCGPWQEKASSLDVGASEALQGRNPLNPLLGGVAERAGSTIETNQSEEGLR